MVTRKGRKVTGGKYRAQRKIRKYEKQGLQRKVKLGETKRKTLRMRGGKKKTVLLQANTANVTMKDGKTKVVKILKVIETPSNRFWARANILVKGAIIETEIGKAKITNRPSQEGTVNAVLIE